MVSFDFHTAALIFAVAFAGGILGLDRTAVGQFMVSQPIVAGPLTGWLLGDTDAGLVIGAVLELIWVLDMPVGTFVPADATIATVSVTAVAVLSSRGNVPIDVIGFSILLAAATVPITMLLDGIIRKYNSRLADAAVSAPGEDEARKLSRAHLSGLIVFFLKSFVLYLFFIPVGLAAVALFELMPQKMHAAMALFVKLLPLLGSALVLRKLSISVTDRSFLAGFAASVVLGFILGKHQVLIILIIITTAFIAARYRTEILRR